MKIRILSSAFNDLADGRDFYERQGEGLAVTFSIRYSPTLIRWRFTPGFIAKFSDFTGCCPNDFHTQFITKSKPATKRWFIACSIAGKTRPKSAQP